MVILALSPAAAVAATAPPETVSPTIAFYLAKGAPDSCGRGCDTWIAAEGKIDSDAAARLRAFLRRHRDSKLPLYIQSPGGSLEQALAIGRLLRERKAVARVARTVVGECGSAPQFDESCVKLKQSGRELQAELVTRGALCGSACPFLLFGATSREVAPDAVLAVHSPRVNLVVRGSPPKAMVAAAMRQGADRADRNMSNYLAEMGIGHGLLDVIRTVKFESAHVLTRDELVQFGIDRREFVETPWTLETGNRATVRKLAIEKRDGANSFRILRWQLSCITANDFRLDYQRQVEGAGTAGQVAISGEAAKPLQFGFPPFKSPGFETWQLRMSKASVQSLAELPGLDVTETSVSTEGARAVHLAKLSTDGLTASVASLLVTCAIPSVGAGWPLVSGDFKPSGAAGAGAKQAP